MLSRYRWAIFLGLFVITVLTMAALRAYVQQHAVTQEAEEAVAEVEYDSWSTGIQTTQFKPDGFAHYVVQAAHQVHYKNNTTMLTEPVIQLFEETQLRWRITANSGRVHGGDSRSRSVELFELIDSVELAHTDPDGARVTLITDFLSVNPNEETMSTSLPVTLLGPGIEQRAVGMHADLARNTLVFFSDLEGRYYANPHP